MYESTFDIVAMGMRFCFALLIAFILLKLLQDVRAELLAERAEKTLGQGYALYRMEVVGAPREAELGRI